MGFVSYGWTRPGNREMKVAVKDGVWYATHFFEGEPDPSMIKIFGTHELATPWEEGTPKEVVVKGLADRNPHAEVS